MTDDKLPKLADGSQWDNDVVVDNCKTEISVQDDLLAIDGPFGHGECEPLDAIAVIRRANLDPLAIAAKELVRVCNKVARHSMINSSLIEAADKVEALL
jgi:hypothetical protein